MNNFDLLTSAWHARNKLYNDLFGNYTSVYPGNYGPPGANQGSDKQQSTSIETGYESGNETGDPGLQDEHLAILTYEPDPLRPYWTYVTAGLSSPWLQNEPQEVSGFGLELLIKSPGLAKWPEQILRTIAFYILNHAGTVSPGTRLALNNQITVNTASNIRNLLIWYADEAPDCWYQLPSGGFGIFAAIGITNDELKFAESQEQYGTWCMQEILRQTGSSQITDPTRESILQNKNIDSLINSVTAFAREFQKKRC